MKKIAMILSFLFVLSSCGVKQEIGKTEQKVVNSTEKFVEKISEEKTYAILKEDSISFSDLEKNLKRLKNADISNEDLSMLNSQFNSYFNNSIERQAVEKSDASICDKADKNLIENCKKQVYIKSGNINSCDSLTDNLNISSCKNNIILDDAIKGFDENICDKLIDESEGKFEIKSCKNRIISNKAIKNLDIKLCNKLDELEKSMCVELVKMEQIN